jgi:AraC-like DNA-binding protein
MPTAARLPLDFLSNPFLRTQGERHALYFASICSFIVPRTGWRGPRQHNFWVLDVVSDRPMRVRVAGKELVRPPESVALYAPDVVYDEFVERGNLVRLSWLLFRVAGSRSPLRQMVRPDGYCLFEDPGSLIHTLIKQVASCFLNPNPGNDWFANSAFYQILELLRSSQGEPRRRIRLPNLQLLREDTSLRNQVENYLAEHPTGRVTAAEMAAHLRLGLSSFTHRYHEQSGETFIQTKLRVRIEQSKALLLAGNLPIKEIAQELGFSDAAHFSRVFHRLVRMPPVMFVKQVNSLARTNP